VLYLKPEELVGRSPWTARDALVPLPEAEPIRAQKCTKRRRAAGWDPIASRIPNEPIRQISSINNNNLHVTGPREPENLAP